MGGYYRKGVSYGICGASCNSSSMRERWRLIVQEV